MRTQPPPSRSCFEISNFKKVVFFLQAALPLTLDTKSIDSVGSSVIVGCHGLMRSREIWFSLCAAIVTHHDDMALNAEFEPKGFNNYDSLMDCKSLNFEISNACVNYIFIINCKQFFKSNFQTWSKVNKYNNSFKC